MVTSTDIANRALQRCGSQRIPAGSNPSATLATDDSKNASEIRACYDLLRRAELRRNVWRFSIRTVALRPIGLQTKLVTFGAYAALTTYVVNDVVLGSDGQLYSSLAAANLGNDPTTSPTKWALYFGTLLAEEYVTTWSASITYALGDHTVGSDGVVYISLSATNLNHNPVGDNNVHWSATTDGATADSEDYYAGEIVYVGGAVYLSKISANADNPPSANWLTLTTAPTVAALNFIYPIGSGPASQSQTMNAYRLPNGFMREAPQAPKAGSMSFLGAPSALAYDDWNFESDYFTTSCGSVILFRFAADIADTTKFDPMFVEGFAARIAFEICEALTQSSAKKSDIAQAYGKFMSEARLVNGIETGSTELPLDDYIACRV